MFFSEVSMLLLEQNKNIQITEEIETLSAELENKFADIMVRDNYLSRQIVSFQGNKQRPIYRWYKYKEGFFCGAHSISI